MCCRPTSSASIPRTGSSFFTASFTAPSPPRSEKAARAFRELVGELGRNFPSDKVEEALKRLIERRYIVPASGSSAGAVAGYWASLGLPPGIAEQNLGNCRVRVESIDVQGAAEFAAALSELGVHVVKRSPDLTVTLVNDYLERRLAELNRQRVSDRTPWLLVQPSGAFPLVGPVFSPGNGACWTCLFDRMIRNREVKGFLDRGPARACRGFAARPQYARAKRHPVCRPRSRQGDRDRLSHRIERSHRQPRFVGRDHRRSITWRPARNVRPAAAKNCGTRAGRRRRSSLAPAPSWS